MMIESRHTVFKPYRIIIDKEEDHLALYDILKGARRYKNSKPKGLFDLYYNDTILKQFQKSLYEIYQWRVYDYKDELGITREGYMWFRPMDHDDSIFE